jgi:hypothetical protein
MWGVWTQGYTFKVSQLFGCIQYIFKIHHTRSFQSPNFKWTCQVASSLCLAIDHTMTFWNILLLHILNAIVKED